MEIIKELFWKIRCNPLYEFLVSVVLFFLPFIIMSFLAVLPHYYPWLNSFANKHDVIIGILMFVFAISMVLSIIFGMIGMALNFNELDGYIMPYRLIALGPLICHNEITPDGKWKQWFSGKMEHWRTGFLTKKKLDRFLSDNTSRINVLERQKSGHLIIAWDFYAE